MMSKAGLAVVPVHAIIRDGHWQEGSWEALESAGHDLVVKPAFLCRGQGITFFDLHPEGGWVQDGRRVSSAEVKTYIEALSREDTCVVQNRVEDHPVFRNLGVKGVITVRVITIKTRAMQDPIGLSASIRIPPVAERMPNLDHAGLYCAVDWDTGTVHAGEGILPGLEDVEHHPETGARLAGLQVPCWSQCKELCFAAHQVDPRYNSMGWDVLISPDGPLLLEANPRWGSISAQLSSHPPLLQTRFPELYEAWPLNEATPGMD